MEFGNHSLYDLGSFVSTPEMLMNLCIYVYVAANALRSYT